MHVHFFDEEFVAIRITERKDRRGSSSRLESGPCLDEVTLSAGHKQDYRRSAADLLCVFRNWAGENSCG